MNALAYFAQVANDLDLTVRGELRPSADDAYVEATHANGRLVSIIPQRRGLCGPIVLDRYEMWDGKAKLVQGYCDRAEVVRALVRVARGVRPY